MYPFITRIGASAEVTFVCLTGKMLMSATNNDQILPRKLSNDLMLTLLQLVDQVEPRASGRA